MFVYGPFILEKLNIGNGNVIKPIILTKSLGINFVCLLNFLLFA